MKSIDCLADLQSWAGYQEFSRGQLKQVGNAPAEPCFITKDKVTFDLDGKSWNGIAFLAGPRAAVCARNLKKEGLVMREGTCTREGKELRIQGLDARFLKEAAKTLKKLLGYRVAGVEDTDDAEGGDAARAGDARNAGPADPTRTPEVRLKRVQELQELSADLGRLLSALTK